MSLFTKKGAEAQKSASEKGLDLKKVYIRLKDGDSVRVRLLGVTDNTVREFKAHGDFKKGIYTSACIAPAGVECPYCIAANSGVEGFQDFYARKRYLITFADIDTGSLRVWDASKQQGEAMLKLFGEYASAKDTMAFTFKRTGSGASDTSYNLIPIFELDEKGKESFEKVGKLEVADDFLDSVLIPRSREDMITNLKNAGFPVEQFFELNFGEDEAEDTQEDIVDDSVEDIAESDIENM